MEKATLKQVEFIMALTRRPFVGSLSEKDFKDKLGKSIWDLDKKEASDLITRLSTREGLDNFLGESK